MAEPARNPFFQQLELLGQSQNHVADSIDALATGIPGTGGVETVLTRVADAIEQLRTSIDDGNRDLLNGLGQIRDKIELHHNGRPEYSDALHLIARRLGIEGGAAGARVAFLYLGVDQNGTFNLSSKLGNMLEQAVGGQSLEDLLKQDAEDFARQAVAVAGSLGFDEITASDFRLFHALAPDVWDRVGKKKRAPKRGATNST